MTIHIDVLDAGHITLRLQLSNGWTVAIPIPPDGDAIMPRCWASHDAHPRAGTVRAASVAPVTADELVEFIALVASSPPSRHAQGEAA